MSGKESKKKGKPLTEKRSVPNFDGSKTTDHTSRRKSKRFHKYRTPCFGAVSKCLETDPPAFPDLDLVTFEDRPLSEGRGDAFGGSTEARDGPTTRTEFKITREDFPALPGTGGEPREPSDRGSGGDEPSERPGEGRRRPGPKPDGAARDVPDVASKDRYGVAGLLSFLRAAERDENLRNRGFGEDLTAYGFDLNSKSFLHPDFYGPFGDRPARPEEVDYDVPKEYLHRSKTKKKLPPVDIPRYDEDTLFYLYYTFVGDRKQLMAAARLHDKGWRYHTEENRWTSLVPDEKKCYFFFDPAKWSKVRVADYEMDVEKLAERPRIRDANPPVREPDRIDSFRSFVPRPIDPNSRTVVHPAPATAESRPVKCVRPAGPRYVATDVERIRGVPAFFCPRIPVPAFPGPFQILDPHAGYRLHQFHPRQRNVRTLYAPRPPCLPDSENDGRRKKRY